MRFKLGAKAFGNIGHLRPLRHAIIINPVEDLFRPHPNLFRLYAKIGEMCRNLFSAKSDQTDTFIRFSQRAIRDVGYKGRAHMGRPLTWK